MTQQEKLDENLNNLKEYLTILFSDKSESLLIEINSILEDPEFMFDVKTMIVKTILNAVNSDLDNELFEDPITLLSIKRECEKLL